MNKFGNDCFSVSVYGFEASFMNGDGDGFVLDDFIGDEDVWRGKRYEEPRYFEAKSVKSVVKGRGHLAPAA